MNQIVLVGRITKDPEINEAENGKKVTSITLAVQRPFKNIDGLYEADFIFSYDGERFVVENHQWFKVATDLIAHAFSKWKRKVLGFWGFLK